MAGSSIHELILQAVGDTRDAEQALNRVARKVLETGSVKAQPEVDVKGVFEAQAKIAATRAALDSLDHKKVTPEVQIKVDRARTALALVQRELSNTVNVLRKKTAANLPISPAEVERLGRALAGVAREAGNVGKLMGEAGGGASNLNQQFGGFLGVVKQINPVLQGLGILILASLVPAFLALGASLLSAAAAVPVLVTAFAAALGPSVLFLLAIFQRLAKILEVVQLRRAAMTAETRKGAAADSAQAQALEAVHNAEIGVRDATQARVSAERSLADAQRNARQELAQDQQDAKRAAEDLKQATVDAYDAIAQAIEGAKTAALDYRDAQLDVEQARLNTRQARRELADLRKQLGLSSDAYDKLFNRLENVSLDPRAVRQAIGNLVKQGKLSGDQADQLEQKRINLQRAINDEKRATENLTISKQKETAAERDANNARKLGIRFYRPYLTALRQSADANKKLATAEHQGVAGNPAVIAAREALRNAIERQKEAQHDLARAQADAKKGLTDGLGPLAVYQKAFGRLSKTEQDFAKLLFSLPKRLKAIAGQGTDAFFGGILDSIKIISPLLGGLKSVFTDLGTVWANNARLFAITLIEPASIAAFRNFGSAAVQVSKILGGGAFRDFFRILRNIATVAIPPLLSLLGDMAQKLSDWASATVDVGNIAPFINTVVTSFREWMKLLGAVGGAIAAVITAAAPFGDQVVGWITDAVKSFSAWLKSAKGKNAVRKFFEDTLPLVKQVMTFIGKLVVVFLQGFQFIAPVLAGVVSQLNDFLSIISFVLGIFNKIVSNPIGRAIRFAIGEFIGFGIVGKIISKMYDAFKLLRGVIGALSGTVSRVVSFVAGKFGFLRTIFSRAIGFFRSAFAARGFVGVVRATFGAVIGFLRSIIGRLVSPFGRVRDGIVGVFRGIAGRVKGIFGTVVGVIKSVINAAIAVVNVAIRALNKIHVKIPSWVPHFGGHGFGIHIGEIQKLAAGGVTDGATIAQIGEAGKEAVLPLQGSALRSVANAIAGALLTSLGQMRRAATLPPAAAMAGAGTVHHNNFHVTPLNSNRDPDPENTAALLALAWKKKRL